MRSSRLSSTATTLASGAVPIATGQRSLRPGGELLVLHGRGRDDAQDDSPTRVRVLVADGERLVRAGLRGLLEKGSGIAVAHEAASGQEAVALAAAGRPDVVVMNVRLPGLDGLEATRQITIHPGLSGVAVLLLSDEEDDEAQYGALQAGATGFLTLNTDPTDLIHAVRVLAKGGVQVSQRVTRRLIEKLSSEPHLPGRYPAEFEELTAREREVVTLVAHGLNNREIAERLVVSPATAKTHVSRSMIKLAVRDRAKLVALAYQTGFARPDR